MFLSCILGLASILLLESCSTSKKSYNQSGPSGYKNANKLLPDDILKASQSNIETYFELIASNILTETAINITQSDPILSFLINNKTPSDAPKANWSASLIETLVVAETTARANSFRNYNNQECFDAFLMPMDAKPFPQEIEARSLQQFIKLGPKISDEQAFSAQIRSLCARRSINSLQNYSEQELATIFLTLKHNVVLRKKILSRASVESTLIRDAYRELLE